MLDYHVFWLAANTLATISALVTVAVGPLILRAVAEDMSNSTAWSTYALRSFRLAPGVLIVVFGCFLLFKIVSRILSLSLPS
jgi:hypothetical protein